MLLPSRLHAFRCSSEQNRAHCNPLHETQLRYDAESLPELVYLLHPASCTHSGVPFRRLQPNILKIHPEDLSEFCWILLELVGMLPPCCLQAFMCTNQRDTAQHTLHTFMSCGACFTGDSLKLTFALHIVQQQLEPPGASWGIRSIICDSQNIS